MEPEICDSPWAVEIFKENADSKLLWSYNQDALNKSLQRVPITVDFQISITPIPNPDFCSLFISIIFCGCLKDYKKYWMLRYS